MTAKRIRLLIIPLALVSLSALLAACGGSSKTAATTAAIRPKTGKEDVANPRHPSPVGAMLRAVLGHQAMEKWAVNCYANQYEELLTPAEEAELGTESEAEFGAFLAPHLQEIEAACSRSGRPIINPHASEAELESMRTGQAKGLGMMLKSENLPAAEIECVEEQFEGLSRDEFLANLEAPEPQREAFGLAMIGQCAAEHPGRDVSDPGSRASVSDVRGARPAPASAS